MNEHGLVRCRAAIAMIAVLAATCAWLAFPSPVFAARRTSVKHVLHATAVQPDAEGDVEENVEDAPTPGSIACCLSTPDQQGCSELTPTACTAAGGVDAGTGTCEPDPCGGGDSETCDDDSGAVTKLRGGLVVTAAGLAPRATFTVNVGSVPVGALKTNRHGRGHKRFMARKLGVDPRGRRVTLTDIAGAAVLVGTSADPTTPCGVACCLNNGDEQGCNQLTSAECAAAGGVDAGTGTCEPDPCPGQGEGSNPPPGSIACCLNTAEEQGCTELLPSDCTAAGGVDAGTGTCEPDPCPGEAD